LANTTMCGEGKKKLFSSIGLLGRGERGEHRRRMEGAAGAVEKKEKGDWPALRAAAIAELPFDLLREGKSRAGRLVISKRRARLRRARGKDERKERYFPVFD